MGKKTKETVLLSPMQELYQSLVKNVFGTYSFENRWDTMPEDYGRTFFIDRSKELNPFNTSCAERLHTLYDSALNGYLSKPSAKKVSDRLIAYAAGSIDSSCEKLYFLETDDEERRRHKVNALLDVVDAMVGYAENKKSTDNYDLKDVSARIKSICLIYEQNIRQLDHSGLDENILYKNFGDNAPNKQQKPVNKGMQVCKKQILDTLFSEDKHFETLTLDQIDYLNSNTVQNGMIVFFIKSSIARVPDFIRLYKKYSMLNIEELPTVFCSRFFENQKGRHITEDEWNTGVQKHLIHPISETKDISVGYDISEIKNLLKNQNKVFYICGNTRLLDTLFEYISTAILIVPENIKRMFADLQIQGYWGEEEAYTRIRDFRWNVTYVLQYLASERPIDYELKNRVPTRNMFSIVPWSENTEKEESFYYYAGLVDCLLTGRGVVNNMEIQFLKQYNQILSKILAKDFTDYE